MEALSSDGQLPFPASLSNRGVLLQIPDKGKVAVQRRMIAAQSRAYGQSASSVMTGIHVVVSLDRKEVCVDDNQQLDRRKLVAGLGLAAAGVFVPMAAHAAQTVTLPKGAVTVVAFVRARAGKEAELVRATEALVPKVRQEAGNLLCQAHRGLDGPGILVFYEIFESAAAFEAHKAAPHTMQWSTDIQPLAAGPVELTLLEALA